MLPRRNFCGGCFRAAALLAVLPWTVMAKPGRRPLRDMPLDRLRFAAFAAHLRTTFAVYRTENEVVPLQLVEATRRRQREKQSSPAPDAGYEKFALLFTGSLDQLLEQRTYRFEHPHIGAFDMFVVPVISRDQTCFHYEAVFNRPRPGTH